MNRTDRLYALVEDLRAISPRCRSARDLARRFEVSARTIERDIGALQQAGVPIYAEPGRRGGYALEKSMSLPPLNFTPAEAVAVAIALVCVLLGLFPAIGLFLTRMPAELLGATLVFSSVYLIVNGVQIVTSRMLDARRTFVVGLGLLAGLSVELVPAMVEALSPSLRTMFGTPLVFGTLTALGLNLVFRIGATRSGVFVVEPQQRDSEWIEARVNVLGAGWGARRDVIERVGFGIAQAAEVLFDNAEVDGPIDVRASFDEFNVVIRMAWQGPPLELPDRRPSAEEIIASDEGARRLAGFLLGRIADRVSCHERSGRSILTLRFDH